MKKPFLIGLTGSIGMGKSTTARMFADLGVPVWDADQVVHRIYDTGGAGVPAIGQIVPDAVVDGRVSRDRLRQAVTGNPGLVDRIEAVIHPIVALDRQKFIETHADAAILLFDIPLLFETGAEDWLDAVAVVTAPEDIQEKRVLARPEMNRRLFDSILARQTPDAIKRQKADYIIETHEGIQAARDRVESMIKQITGENFDA